MIISRLGARFCNGRYEGRGGAFAQYFAISPITMYISVGIFYTAGAVGDLMGVFIADDDCALRCAGVV